MIEYTLRQLEVFTAATEQESLTRAADQLHLTQSTASTHLRSLEQCLGTTLLLRRGQGGVTLTEDGQRLYPLAKKILTQCQALADAALNHHAFNGLGVLQTGHDTQLAGAIAHAGHILQQRPIGAGALLSGDGRLAQ